MTDNRTIRLSDAIEVAPCTARKPRANAYDSGYFDAIIAYQNALSALPAVEGWMDISDDTKKLCCVIACHAGQDESVGPVWWKRGKWTMEDGETWRDGWLTHYMPLPAPPIE